MARKSTPKKPAAPAAEAPAETAAAAAPALAAPDTIEAFAAMVTGMTRLLDRVSRLEAFTASGLHVAEWQALLLIGTTPDIGNKLIARTLGVSVQRAQQIGDWLQKRGFVGMETSGDDARRKTITITPAGEACLKDTRDRLAAQIEAEIDNSGGVISRTGRLLRSFRGLGAAKKDAGEPAQGSAAASA